MHKNKTNRAIADNSNTLVQVCEQTANRTKVHKNKNRGKQMRTSVTPHIEFDFEKSKSDSACNPANRVKIKQPQPELKKLHRNVNSALKNVEKEIETILSVNAV